MRFHLSKEDIMNSNFNKTAQLTMVKCQGYFFVKYKTNSLDQSRSQQPSRASPGDQTID
jgi:hypothetical protein